jgi:hypothetical protein
VQGLLSLHPFVLFVKTHPVAALQLSVVHSLSSLQTMGVPGWHVPPPQVSPVAQAFPSSHGFVLFVNTQPAAGSHVSDVQTLLSLHTTALPGWQVPPPHVSPAVQASPSSHETVLFVCKQPATASQKSSVHGLPSSQDAEVLRKYRPPVLPPPLSPQSMIKAPVHTAVWPPRADGAPIKDVGVHVSSVGS